MLAPVARISVVMLRLCNSSLMSDKQVCLAWKNSKIKNPKSETSVFPGSRSCRDLHENMERDGERLLQRNLRQKSVHCDSHVTLMTKICNVADFGNKFNNNKKLADLLSFCSLGLQFLRFFVLLSYKLHYNELKILSNPCQKSS